MKKKKKSIYHSQFEAPHHFIYITIVVLNKKVRQKHSETSNHIFLANIRYYFKTVLILQQG